MVSFGFEIRLESIVLKQKPINHEKEEELKSDIKETNRKFQKWKPINRRIKNTGKRVLIPKNIVLIPKSKKHKNNQNRKKIF